MRVCRGAVCARPNPTEITADAFLNWVRVQFDTSAKGQAWLSFFEDANQRIGMFLRNAVIWQIGMIPYYQPIIFTPSPVRDVIDGTNIRLSPEVTPSTDIPISLSTTRTYGWANNDGQTWFLIDDPMGRLVWIITDGIQFDTPQDRDADLSPSRQITDPMRLSPGRPYDNSYNNTDLLTILGEKTTA